jgi:hypothetical protein
MIVQGYACILLGTYLYITCTVENPRDRYATAFGVLLLAPLFGRVFGWF